MSIRDEANERKKRFTELLEQSRAHSTFYFTDFMTEADASEIYAIASENDFTIFGGQEMCERVMIRFGNVEELGYVMDFPIALIKIAPLQKKFSDALSHRDFLGTLMGLGIERSVIGDIYIKENAAFVFVAERMTDFIIESVNRVKHTTVTCERMKEIPSDITPHFSDAEVIVSSLRLDGLIAKTFHLSRGQGKELFARDAVFVDGHPVRNSSILPKKGAKISVRGFGKFIIDGELRSTKKGNTVVSIRKYV